MSVEHNKSVVRRFFDEGLSPGNMSVLEQLLAGDFKLNGAPPGLSPDAEGFKILIGMFRSAFPDYRDSVDDLIAEGDHVAVRWTLRGTHTGEFQGIPPTGKTVTVAGTSLFRVAGSQIGEDWTVIDLAGLLGQLGVLPPPGAN
jgi:steroid delta-isomerase-like uncharacterized protein